jgi:hypothetical protein
MEKAIATSIPSGTEEINLAAFAKGYEFGTQKLKTR